MKLWRSSILLKTKTTLPSVFFFSLPKNPTNIVPFVFQNWFENIFVKLEFIKKIDMHCEHPRNVCLYIMCHTTLVYMKFTIIDLIPIHSFFFLSQVSIQCALACICLLSAAYVFKNFLFLCAQSAFCIFIQTFGEMKFAMMSATVFLKYFKLKKFFAGTFQRFYRSCYFISFYAMF